MENMINDIDNFVFEWGLVVEFSTSIQYSDEERRFFTRAMGSLCKSIQDRIFCEIEGGTKNIPESTPVLTRPRSQLAR